MVKVIDPLIDNKRIYHFETQFLHYFGWVTKITVALFFLGFFQEKPTVFVTFNFVVKLCLALFLIYRFNNYRKHEIVFTDLDRKVCYSAGIYILIITFTDYVNYYTNDIRNVILPYTTPLWDKLKGGFKV
jgi:hypothetical protein